MTFGMWWLDKGKKRLIPSINVLEWACKDVVIEINDVAADKDNSLIVNLNVRFNLMHRKVLMKLTTQILI